MTFKQIVESLTAIAIMVLMLSPIYGLATDSDPKGVAVRIGWQIPAATQGQITQVLKRTDALENRGLNPTFVPYSFGTPQVEAALAGKLDVIFSGDQPAINMITQGGSWKIAARLTYDRVALMVPKNSPIKEIKDLRGKTVASPFGSIAHREAVIWEQAAGLDSDEDVNNVDMDILDIRKLVTAGGGEKWGEVDAVAVWESSTSYFELDQLARKLETTPTL